MQNLIFDFAASAAGRAYRHTLLCLFGVDDDFAARFRAAGIEAASCSVPWPESLDLGSYRASRWLRHRLTFTFPFRLARALRKLSPDLVHTHVSHRIDLQAEGVLRLAALPLIWTIHNQYRPEGRSSSAGGASRGSRRDGRAPLRRSPTISSATSTRGDSNIPTASA